MEANFRLDSSSIQKLINTFESSTKNTIDAQMQYKIGLEQILGRSWKGKASKKFQQIIDEYEKCTQYFINEIIYRKSVTEEAMVQFGIVNSNSNQVTAKMQNINE